MGNGIGKFTGCLTGGEVLRRRKDSQIFISDPLGEGLGHSFCYIRPDPYENPSSKVYSDETTTFRSISGASVSANASTPLSTSDFYTYNSADRASSAFESSTSFCSIPLQPVPKNLTKSGSGNFSGFFPGSGLVERGFLSGPIERGFMSGPIEKQDPLFCSGPLKTESSVLKFRRSVSHSGFGLGLRSRKGSLMGGVRRAISKKMFRSHQNSIVAPVKKEPDWIIGGEGVTVNNSSLNTMSSECSLDYEDSLENQNLQWAQGKAGEDRVHVVVSDEFEWVFVGIYDGFNGPDAPDYLLSNLYVAVRKELKGLLWDDDDNKYETTPPTSTFDQDSFNHAADDLDFARVRIVKCCDQSLDQENYPCDVNFEFDPRSRKNGRNKYHRGAAKKWEENQRRWKCEWDRERLELDKRLKEQLNSRSNSKSINHSDVLKALSRALRKTEEAYLNIADMMVMENPELALMGSCVLVMLMKGEDVYVLNVGDSRAVLAQKAEPDFLIGKGGHDLERINEETLHDLETCDFDRLSVVSELIACQLTVDHSTNMEEEVRRIKKEHQDDACAVMNDRVKGSLKVTRAFGAGFLKQPKWNDALLEMFRIDYIGTSPYITCFPSLHHHRLGPKDRFLILSSDGLYQYFTNQEAVAEVELFIAMQPEGDPAQHLIEELMFRAAKKAGLDFHELLEIPQGDRRRYHDDVSIIVISLEGRIWRSCVYRETPLD